MSGLSAPLASYRWYAGEAEQRTLYWTCAAIIGQFGLAALALLSGINAPYGRYNTESEKKEKKGFERVLAACDVPAKLAWVLQECPTLIAAGWGWSTASPECKASTGNRLTLLCFVTHYINRTLIYPMRTKGSKPIPLSVMLMAMGFCGINGYVQCRSLTRHVVVPSNWTLPAGIALWLAGFWINTDADKTLRELRKPGETGYKIPYGGMFNYVSGANFFGEIVEWTGYALAMGGALPGVMFAFCTAANIGPRAVAHHKWYLQKFKEEYPKERKALIPFIW